MQLLYIMANYSAEGVIDLLDDEGEEIFCEGSDEEFGLFDDEDENDHETIDEAEHSQK